MSINKEIQRQQELIKANISRSFKVLTIDDEIEKGKSFPPGTIREWGGKKYKKHPDGEWKIMSEGKQKEDSSKKQTKEESGKRKEWYAYDNPEKRREVFVDDTFQTLSSEFKIKDEEKVKGEIKKLYNLADKSGSGSMADAIDGAIEQSDSIQNIIGAIDPSDFRGEEDKKLIESYIVRAWEGE